MTLRLAHFETITNTTITNTSNSTPYMCGRAKSLSAQIVVSATATKTAKTFVDANVNTSTDVITIATHGFVNGLKVAATTTGVLPGGLSATNYYVIYVTASTIKLASSLANAEAGTAVDITSAAGGGTHTLTPAALAGGSVTMQKSNDYDPIYNTTGTWDAVAVATAITTDGDIWIADTDPAYKWVRFSFTLTAGTYTAVTTFIAKDQL